MIIFYYLQIQFFTMHVSNSQKSSPLSMKTEVMMRKRKQREYEDEYLKSLPAGYRFYPNDKEIFLNYLKPKLHNQSLPPNRIIDVKLSLYDPEFLAGYYST